MSQIEIYEFLKKNKGRWYNANDLHEKFATHKRCIRKIMWLKEIEYKFAKRKGSVHTQLYIRYVPDPT
jgi:hypothetical protein